MKTLLLLILFSGSPMAQSVFLEGSFWDYPHHELNVTEVCMSPMGDSSRLRHSIIEFGPARATETGVVTVIGEPVVVSGGEVKRLSFANARYTCKFRWAPETVNLNPVQWVELEHYMAGECQAQAGDYRYRFWQTLKLRAPHDYTNNTYHVLPDTAHHSITMPDGHVYGAGVHCAGHGRYHETNEYYRPENLPSTGTVILR